MKIIDIYEKINKYRQVTEPQEVFDQIWKLDNEIVKSLINNTEGIEPCKLSEYEYGKDDDRHVIAPKEYADMYMYYVMAYYDLLYQDTENYTNNQILFNNMYNEFAAEYRREHRTRSDHRIVW